ncbi:GNAT family N-acetyltransferase [Endozoicomonas gorgoniicola]|uniref:GNAT family N-acetyltransferase n=1 Tax=Endozoicomonas gorgoniicola TaxID=1234144 RepID=A0ABT3MTJ6_9GAMM|nr:GNAT family N-acetyltransferase [Endozoicomonas gorgoniicola]MCW7552693.1 GNAT family N-acetyltransferase [Endozoicomonas gorgoniicola]
MGVIRAPELLTKDHNTDDFDCGHDVLTEWLKKTALKNQSANASRTFVVCKGDRVVGYYALSSGSIERMQTPKSLARNMPDPIPVTVLGRLAIDQAHQGMRIGSGLLKDAMMRTLVVSQHIGVKAMLVHAISEEARQFYLQYGFKESTFNPMTLMLPVKHIVGLFPDQG